MIVTTLTGTVHPQAKVIAVHLDTQCVDFQWLDAAGNTIDQGIALAPMAITALPITEAQIQAAIQAVGN